MHEHLEVKIAAQRLAKAAEGNSNFYVGSQIGTAEIGLTEKEGGVDYSVNNLAGDDGKAAMNGSSTADDAKATDWAGLVKLGKAAVTIKGAALNLQIGDTAEDFNQLKVNIKDIHTKSMGIADISIATQEGAAAYIRKYQRGRQALPRLMRLLRLGDRPPAPSEERYLLAWAEMGFTDEAVERAYDKTILKCKELKWSYMNRILCSWHEKGLHTLEEISAGDRPGRAAAPRREAGPSAREDMARMEKYLQHLRREKEAE